MLRSWMQLACAVLAIGAAWGFAPTVSHAQALNGELFFVHGLPGDDVGLPNRLPVDVSIGFPGNLSVIFQGVEFGSISGPVSLSPGTYQIAVAPANPNDPGSEPPVLTGTVAIRSFESWSFVAHISQAGTPTGTRYQNDRSFAGFLNARVAVRHTANAGPVDSYFNSLFGFPGIAFLGVTAENESVPAALFLGPYRTRLTPAGVTQVNLLPPSNQFLFPWNTYHYYVVGTPLNGTLQIITHRIPPNLGLFP